MKGVRTGFSMNKARNHRSFLGSPDQTVSLSIARTLSRGGVWNAARPGAT